MNIARRLPRSTTFLVVTRLVHSELEISVQYEHILQFPNCIMRMHHVTSTFPDDLILRGCCSTISQG